MDRYKFGEFIYQKRKSLGLTQEELGRKVGVTNKAVSKWEVGETLPDVMMLEPLAQVLQVTIDELLTHTDKKEEEKKNIKINKVFLFIIIGLVILEILTVVLFIVLNYQPEEEPEIVRYKVQEDNFSEIVNLNPLANITCMDQTIVIDSMYCLDSDYCLENDEQELTFVVSYRYNYFYYRNDGTLGVVTYYNRTVDVKLTNLEKQQTISIILEPQIEIENFEGFKNIEIDYSIYGFTGLVIDKVEEGN